MALSQLVWAQAEAPAGAAPAPAAPSSDPKQRAKSLRDYGSASGVETKMKVGRIGPYVRDADLGVQRTAVDELAKLGGPESLDPLLEATRINDEAVQLRAAGALVNYYSPGYVEQGLAALKARVVGSNDAVIERHVEVRADVIAALGRLTGSGASLAVQASAARGLGVLRGKAALPELIRALRTKDSRVLYESLVAIRKIGDRSVASEITYLLRDLNEDVQVAAIDATGQLQNRAAAVRLRELASDAGSAGRGKRVRPAAVNALAQMPDEADRGLYESHLADPDPAVRTAAVEGIARLNRTSDVTVASGLFEKEKKMEPRLAAGFAAVMLGNRSLTEFAPLRYLINTLNSVAYRGVAAGYLEELCRQPEARRSIMAVVPAMNREEKSRIVTLLGRSGAGDKAVEDLLIMLTRDTDVAVGQAAAQALRALRTGR